MFGEYSDSNVDFGTGNALTGDCTSTFAGGPLYTYWAPRTGKRQGVTNTNDPNSYYQWFRFSSRHQTLQVCMGESAPTFDLVLVGPHVGLPPVEMFVAKLRALPKGVPGRLIGVVPKGVGGADSRRVLFDAVVEAQR